MFQAYARVKIFAVVLETQVNMPTLDLAQEVLLGIYNPEKSQKKIVKSGRANEVALAHLTV